MPRTAHNSRPEIQARKLADMASPEWRRRRDMYIAARGLKKRKVAEWNRVWSASGRPADFPDFDEFWRSHPQAVAWLERRKADLAAQRDIERKHAEWVAAGMPGIPHTA